MARTDDTLVCPSCGREHTAQERFCVDCEMPLVYPEGAAEPDRPSSERLTRAQKVKPQYSEGKLVKVARARSQPEAELLQGLLLNQGIPSMTQRAPGFDVPEFLAVGPRDIFVPESGAEVAREVLQPAPGWG
jgi:hypothetical protein